MRTTIAVAILISSCFSCAWAHQATATYVANEAVLIANNNHKVLFDPFFHKDFGTYQLVPDDIKQAIFDAAAPYDGITAIVISHAHGDHFAADEVVRYLQKYPNTQLVAPAQAIDELNQLPETKRIQNQLHPISLDFNQSPVVTEIAGLTFEAVRIPHAGWPSRADVENLVFRVTLNHSDSPVTIMHLGDADPEYEHYSRYQEHWQKQITDTAFPPYWFYLSAEGNYILENMLNIKQSIGIHVPVDVPIRLQKSGKHYFSTPGEVTTIKGLNTPK